MDDRSSDAFHLSKAGRQFRRLLFDSEEDSANSVCLLEYFVGECSVLQTIEHLTCGNKREARGHGDCLNKSHVPPYGYTPWAE